MIELCIFFVALLLGIYIHEMCTREERAAYNHSVQALTQTVLDLWAEVGRLTDELEEWRLEATAEDDGDGWKNG